MQELIFFRYNIGKSVSLYGEAGELDLAAAEKEIDVLRQKIASMKYSKENIYNMDEAPLFYRAMPTKTYERAARLTGDKWDEEPRPFEPKTGSLWCSVVMQLGHLRFRRS